jgi:hypothetical protein
MVTNPWKTTVLGDRTDWSELKQRLALGVVATGLLGPSPGRRGERGLWWRCAAGAVEGLDRSASVRAKKCELD